MFASEFDFDLPDELIAQHPVEPRDRSRLMVVDRRRGCWEHRTFADLPELLDPRDVLVRNNTRVVPARLVGYRAVDRRQVGGAIPARAVWGTLGNAGDHPGPARTGRARGRRPGPPAGAGSPSARRAHGSSGLSGTETMMRRRSLCWSGTVRLPYLLTSGTGAKRAGDRLAYQTVYARWPGSVAAPTAGLHFTDAALRRAWPRRGIIWVDLTLHVGVGTFRPIEAERLDDHVMHAEWAELSAETVATLEARRAGRGTDRGRGYDFSPHLGNRGCW